MRIVIKGCLALLMIFTEGLFSSAVADQLSGDGLAAGLAGSECAAKAVAWQMKINLFEKAAKSKPAGSPDWHDSLNQSIEAGEDTLALCEKDEVVRKSEERLMEIRSLLASLYARRAYHNVFGGGEPKLGTPDINRLVLQLDHGFNDDELIVFWRAFMYIMSGQVEAGKKEMASIRARYGDDYDLIKKIDRLIATRK